MNIIVRYLCMKDSPAQRATIVRKGTEGVIHINIRPLGTTVCAETSLFFFFSQTESDVQIT